MRILVCDDDEAMIGMVRFKLSREDLGEVIKATDGRQALELLSSNSFDLVVTDINMPYHSGLDIIRYIREVLRRDTPIIVLSVEGLESTVLQAFELGANDFISKPFRPSELAVRVRKLLGINNH